MQILLEPSKEELLKRVAARAAEGGHFMPASLLDSQLAALEPDASALIFRKLTSRAAAQCWLAYHC